ncbi:MAG: B12-binding domain-containing radical SAM protein [Deltaproteobacteria bacterium]|nr:B12-binding domain-containing radical SAM protein [Deltaproteobacteria bacterium]
MRILLIAPRSEYPEAIPGWILVPQMSLLILEALSSNGHQVTIVEEDSAPIPRGEKWDLVGITVMTATASRAYALAREFRAQGAKVVLGGIHPSVLPEEAGRHADAIVVGEAEGVWPQILTDAARDQLRPIYYNHLPETIQVPLVDYRQNGKKPLIPTASPIISGRGCPNRCEFCSVPRIYGTRVRKVPVAQVLEQVKRNRSYYIVFLDDNLTANREYALALFEGLRELKVRFIGQVTVRFILDDALFRAALAAGLKGICVGFETVEDEGRQRLKKLVSLAAYREAIRKCRSSQIFLHGSFIFGLDEHDKNIFGRTLDFIIQNKITSVGAYMLTPYPGTPLFDRMVAEGRLLHRNWAFYDHSTPVFLPKRMTLGELAEGYVKFREAVFSLWGIARRYPAGLAVASAYLHVNAALRRVNSRFRDHYENYFNWLKQAGLGDQINKLAGDDSLRAARERMNL